jgi:hypothetical protein
MTLFFTLLKLRKISNKILNVNKKKSIVGAMDFTMLFTLLILRIGVLRIGCFNASTIYICETQPVSVYNYIGKWFVSQPTKYGGVCNTLSSCLW